jgi:mRNA interferase RelE/StbE
MSWEIRYRSSVEKDISRLPHQMRAEILENLTSLGVDPFPAGCKKLKGQKNRFRIKVARDYRIVYSLFRKEGVIIVEFVGHRRDAYRWF